MTEGSLERDSLRGHEVIKAAVIFANYGPYHLARAKALTQVHDITPRFIELARETYNHPWAVDRQACSIPLTTLSELPYECCSLRDLSRALRTTLEDLDPDI